MVNFLALTINLDFVQLFSASTCSTFLYCQILVCKFYLGSPATKPFADSLHYLKIFLIENVNVSRTQAKIQ